MHNYFIVDKYENFWKQQKIFKYLKAETEFCSMIILNICDMSILNKAFSYN